MILNHLAVVVAIYKAKSKSLCLLLKKFSGFFYQGWLSVCQRIMITIQFLCPRSWKIGICKKIEWKVYIKSEKAIGLTWEKDLKDSKLVFGASLSTIKSMK